jgi:hypothetical protein
MNDIVVNRTQDRLCIESDPATLDKLESLFRDSGAMVHNLQPSHLTRMGLPSEYVGNAEPVEARQGDAPSLTPMGANASEYLF